MHELKKTKKTSEKYKYGRVERATGNFSTQTHSTWAGLGQGMNSDAIIFSQAFLEVDESREFRPLQL